jgi:hypothetical protein
MSDRPSDRDLLRQLHRAVLELLNERLENSRVPVELLQVVRRFLRDSGQLGIVTEAGERKRLGSVYEMYVTRLQEALKTERPSAAILTEVHKFLQTQGIGKDLGAQVDKAAALAVLVDQRLPFKH